MPAGQPQVWVKASPPTWHCLAGRICPQPAPMWREGATSQRISDTWGVWHPFLGQGACLWVWVGDCYLASPWSPPVPSAVLSSYAL